MDTRCQKRPERETGQNMDPVVGGEIEEQWRILTSGDHLKWARRSEAPGFAVKEIENSGRGLVATGGFDQGQLILMERPLVRALATPSRNRCPGCDTASQELVQRLGVGQPCRCRLTFCGPDCDLRADHSLVECRALSGNPNDETAGPDPSADLMLMRCQALEASGGPAWDRFLQLRPAPQRLPADSGETLARILEANSFRKGKYGRVLFAALSMLNHECAPNAKVVFRKGGWAALEAIRPIEAGAQVTISYCAPLQGTQIRRSKLKKSKSFDCVCRRCSDPTELGTFMSALRCPRCPKGEATVLPESFLTPPVQWSCRTTGCGFTTTPEKVAGLLDHVEFKLSKFREGREGVEKVERFVQEVASRKLHEDHYLVLELRSLLFSMNQLVVRDEKSVRARLDHVRRQQGLLDNLLLANSRLKGFLVYQEHLLQVEEVAVLSKDGKLPDSEGLREKGSGLLSSATRSLEILQDDAFCPAQLWAFAKHASDGEPGSRAAQSLDGGVLFANNVEFRQSGSVSEPSSPYGI